MKKTTIVLFMLFACICYCCEDNDKTNDPMPEPPVPPTADTTPVNEGISPDAVLTYGIKETGTRAVADTFARFATFYAWNITMNEGYVKDIPGYRDTVSFYIGRDTVNCKLKFRGWDVIKEDSTLGPMILAHDVLLCAAKDSSGNYTTMLEGMSYNPFFDTIAYIPNQKLKDNLKVIQEYYDNKQFDRVYQMFDTAYNFIPITGAEWLQLKKDSIE